MSQAMTSQNQENKKYASTICESKMRGILLTI